MAPLTPRARRLRHDETDAERRLWQRLRVRQCGGAKFRRQHPIPPFIVDFCCVEHHLIVELDGGQHASRQDEDVRRTRFLERLGFTVLRFWNTDVLKELDAVLEVIHRALRRVPPHPNPLPWKGERVR